MLSSSLTKFELIWEGSVVSVKQVVPGKWLTEVALGLGCLMFFSVPHEPHVGEWFRYHAEREVFSASVCKLELLDGKEGSILWSSILRI